MNFPYCFYPTAYNGYYILNKTENQEGATAFLKRGRSSNVAADIDLLRVDVVKQTNQIVRIRITDANNKRWEPPFPVPPPPAPQSDAPIFRFSITDDRKLEVKRFDGNQATTTL